ncbi:MAG: type II secretion system secretin GspD [Thermodesulfovibrionales bacterium]
MRRNMTVRYDGATVRQRESLRYRKQDLRFMVVCILCLVSCIFHPLSGAFAQPVKEADLTDKPKEQKVAFNFVDVELPVITKFISEITKKNFIFDERVKGKITIIAPSKISINDAYNLFLSVLELKGFTIVPSGVDAYKIIPSSEAKQRGIEIAKDREPVKENYIARLIPLKHISSEEAIKFIQPLVSRDGYSSAFGPGNLILVIDSGLNIEKILNVIENIDQATMREMPEIIYLKHGSADSVARIINEGMTKKKLTPQTSAEEPKAVSDSRLNAVILFGDRNSREIMKSLIALLDVPSREAQGRINVYFLENADATEMVKSLENVIKASQTQRQVTATPGAPPVTPFEAAGAINITADKATNALIIVASPSDYQNLLQVIKQLDRRRRQVYVEAMIVEASVDKLRELGAKWRVMARSQGEPVVIGGFGTLDPSSIQSVIYGLEGVTIGGMGNFLKIPVITTDANGNPTVTDLTVPGFAALFSLDDFRDAVNVLSTPQILTSDNKEAEIVVGENVPFISKRERDLTTTGTILSSIERKDVGITLKITPQITEGDYVKLDIYQEISSLKQDSETILINIGPTTTKRSTKTSVVVKDRETVVIGGLMQERDEENLRKMPVLGDIPILGWLFKHKRTEKRKTNLLVFLTPHIVKDSERLTELTIQKRREMAMNEAQYVEGEVLIKFREGVSDKRAMEIIEGERATLLRVIEGTGIYHIRLQKGDDVIGLIKRLSKLPEVDYAEPNYIIRKRDIR